MQNNPLDEFCSKHRIKIIDTNKRAHVATKININNYFQDPSDYNRVFRDVRYETEPLYTVEITQSELEKIAEFEKQVFNHLEEHGHYNMFNIMMEQKEKEKRLRDKYPAVKKAYEHYSLILKLAENGEYDQE